METKDKNSADVWCPHTGDTCNCIYGPVPVEITTTINGERRIRASLGCGKLIAKNNIRNNLITRIKRNMSVMGD